MEKNNKSKRQIEKLIWKERKRFFDKIVDNVGIWLREKVNFTMSPRMNINIIEIKQIFWLHSLNIRMRKVLVLIVMFK